ncbi:MAG: PilZ domain-containing protein [Candidatus Krumholzibacteriia bacterium]
MIKETMAAIGLASRRAAATTLPRADWTSQIAHVREWSFAMPHLTRVTVANSPVHQIYIGPSRSLLQALGPDDGRRRQVMEQFLETFKVNLLAALPSKRPILSWETLAPSAEPWVLRGVRSFILRHHAAAGNLYLMADLASRQEYESMRDAEWLEQLAAQLLPDDLGRIDCIENQVMLDRVTTFLTRCEHDVELLLPGPDGEVHCVNGVVLRRVKREEQPALQLSLDLDRRAGVELKPGCEIEGAFGAAGRVFRFRTACLGTAEFSLDSLGQLPVFDLAVPRRYHLDQRRRYYRVPPAEALAARLTVLATGSEGEDEAADADGLAVCEATVDDLSFSGAGLAFAGTVPAAVAAGAKVRVDLDGSELPRPLSVTGMVRRVQSLPCGRGRQETHVGLEFVVSSVADRDATQLIRQYVMARQRGLLSQRSRDAVTSRN